MAAISVVGSAVLGIVLGTLLTSASCRCACADPAYIEIWRGLPIIVTIFIIYFALPTRLDVRSSNAFTGGGDRADPVGQRPGRRGDAGRRAVDPARAARGRVRARLRLGRPHAYVIVPQAFRRLLPPLVGLLVNVIQNTTIAAMIGVAETLETGKRQVERLTYTTAELARLRDLRRRDGVFFVISFPLTRLAAYLERRLASDRSGGADEEARSGPLPDSSLASPSRASR